MIADQAPTAPFVALFTGPPGCGKSTLAEHVAERTGAPVANWDWLMSGIRVFPDVWASVEYDAERRRDVGYSLMLRLTEQQLRRGQSIVLDVIARPRAHDRFRTLAQQHGARFAVVECTCSDLAVHESRVVGRRRDIPGWDELEWSWVLHSISIYQPVSEPKLRVDAVDSLATNLAKVGAYLGLDLTA